MLVGSFIVHLGRSAILGFDGFNQVGGICETAGPPDGEQFGILDTRENV
jgi:hypothetical protein